MPYIKINGHSVEYSEGETVLNAAERTGVNIPTICFLKGYPHFTSCMVCVVFDRTSGRMIPSCSSRCEQGQDIFTDTPDVLSARKTAIELLLSEHTGDCEAPCTSACPAGTDIPGIMRLCKSGETERALRSVRDTLPLAGLLGILCRAFCEKACRRKFIDRSLNIKSVISELAQREFSAEDICRSAEKSSGKKRVVVAGTGFYGLSAAFCLGKEGYECVILYDSDKAGKDLRKICRDNSAESVLNREIELLEKRGCEFISGNMEDSDLIKNLAKDYDAVLLASENFIIKEEIENVFKYTRSLRSTEPVYLVRDGKKSAQMVFDFLNNSKPEKKIFCSRISSLTKEEAKEYIQAANADTESSEEYVSLKDEAGLCLECDCIKKNNCKLRDYATEYRVKTRPFESPERVKVQKRVSSGRLVQEPGKCIKCGLCVRMCQYESEKTGMTFSGRGYEVSVSTSLNRDLDSAFERIEKKVVELCPTGALSYREKK